MLSLESEGLNILNDCLRKCDWACGGLAESWIPHNFGFLLKAEIWQLLLERRKESSRSVEEAVILGEASWRPELRVSPHESPHPSSLR